MSIKIDEKYLTQTLIDLIRIDSSNPSLTPGAPGEGKIATYIAESMRTIGLEVHTYKLTPDRSNVVGILRGAGEGHSLMWNAHMDTVGVEGMSDPFGGRLQDGRVYGRGAQDMKGSLAAMLASAKALNQSGTSLDGDLILTAVADEEFASIGTTAILEHYHADAAIVTEPTDLALCTAHRGFIIYKIETMGRAAHGSRFKEGIDAILHMGRILSQLDQLEVDLRNRNPHPLVGPPSLHAGTIRGGTEVSVYPSDCQLYVERRTVPGESVEDATQDIYEIIAKLSDEDPAFNAALEVEMVRSPLEISKDSAIASVVEQAITARTGKTQKPHGATFWTDAALLADAGIETVILGPLGGGLHSAVEWVDLDSVIDLAYILSDAALRFCRKKAL